MLVDNVMQLLSFVFVVALRVVLNGGISNAFLGGQLLYGSDYVFIFPRLFDELG